MRKTASKGSLKNPYRRVGPGVRELRVATPKWKAVRATGDVSLSFLTNPVTIIKHLHSDQSSKPLSGALQDKYTGK